MKAKLIVEGKEFDVEISDPKLQELVAPKRQTGYERVKEDVIYFYNGLIAGVASGYEDSDVTSNSLYNSANYYSNKTVAENNARADTLMRRLRRFAVEHREEELDWHQDTSKYYIRYSHHVCKLYVDTGFSYQVFGAIYFDSDKTAQLAIDTFHDELIWYFTEYKDSL